MSSEQRRWVLSGGLASGKSSVRRFLYAAGVGTIDSDAVGHEMLQPDGAAFAQVAERWPSVVADDAIDRAALAAIVFGDTGQLRELEAITHPHIFDSILARVKGLPGVIVVEIPLLHHSLGEGWRRMVVDSADETRLQRAIDRGMDREDAVARMATQPTRAQWLAAADLVIPNHGSEDDLEAAVSDMLPHL